MDKNKDVDKNHKNSEALAELGQFVEEYRKTNPKCKVSLQFTFQPYSVGPYGQEGSQWAAELVYEKEFSVEYGHNIQQAAQRLLYLLRHPEEYDDTD